MKLRFLFFSILFIFCIFSHFINKHKITNYGKEIIEMEKIDSFEMNLNQELLTEYSNLACKERICHLAEEKLGMFASNQQDEKLVFIEEESKKNRLEFCLIDYITPNLDAISTK